MEEFKKMFDDYFDINSVQEQIFFEQNSFEESTNYISDSKFSRHVNFRNFSQTLDDKFDTFGSCGDIFNQLHFDIKDNIESFQNKFNTRWEGL